MTDDMKDTDYGLEDILPDNIEDYSIVMSDEETGKDYTFYMADDFIMDGTVYLVLLNLDEEPEAIFAKVVTLDDGTEGFETLDDEEFDKAAAFYERLCEETQAEDEDADYDYDEEPAAYEAEDEEDDSAAGESSP